MTLISADKEKVKRVVPKGSNKVIDATVARLYIAYPDTNEWTYTGLSGAMILVDDLVGHTFFLKLVDINGHRGVLWDQELYLDFQYNQDRSFFHTFETEDCLAGLLFDDTSDASHFFKRVTSREKHGSKKTVQNKNAIALQRKPEAPRAPGPRGEFTSTGEQRIRRTTHVQYYDDLPPPEWRSLYAELESAGITEDMIADNKEFIKDYINKQGGPLVGLEPPIPRKYLQRKQQPEQAPTLSHSYSTKKKAPPPPPPGATSSYSPSGPATPTAASARSRSTSIASSIPQASEVESSQSPQETPEPLASSQPVHRVPPPLLNQQQHNVPPPPPAASSPSQVPPPFPPQTGRPTPPLPTGNRPVPPPLPAGNRPTPPLPPNRTGAPPPAPPRAGFSSSPAPPAPPQRFGQPSTPPIQQGRGPPPAPPPRRSGAPPPAPPSRSTGAPPPAPPPRRQPIQPPQAPPRQQQQQQFSSIPSPPPPQQPQQHFQQPSAAPIAPPLPQQQTSAPAPPPLPPQQTSGGPPPPPPPFPTQASSSSAAPPPPPLPQGNEGGPTAPLPQVDSGRDALLSSIRGAGIGSLRKTDKSQLDKPSVILQEQKGEAPPPSTSTPGGGGGSLADALAVALNKRKTKVSKSDDESDGEEW